MTVYVNRSKNRNALIYHDAEDSCIHVKEISNPKPMDKAEAERLGYRRCKRCAGEHDPASVEQHRPCELLKQADPDDW